MNKQSTLVEMLIENLQLFSKSSIELVKLKLIRKFTNVVLFLVPLFVMSIFLSIVFLFANIGLAFWIGSLIGKTFYGFLIVAATYFLLAIVTNSYLKIYLNKLITKFVNNHLLD
jgi:hypothetical protein